MGTEGSQTVTGSLRGFVGEVVEHCDLSTLSASLHAHFC